MTPARQAEMAAQIVEETAAEYSLETTKGRWALKTRITAALAAVEAAGVAKGRVEEREACAVLVNSYRFNGAFDLRSIVADIRARTADGPSTPPAADPAA